MKAILVLAVIVCTHYGYEIAAWLGDSTSKESSYWFYVFRGIEGAVLCALLVPMFHSERGIVRIVGIFALILGMLEESQTAVCGMAGMDLDVPLWSTLCIERFGPMSYLALTALAITLAVKGITKNEERD